MTAARYVLILRLQTAINEMAARYGLACMTIAYAENGTAEHVAAHRAAARQYRALMRLTSAMTDLAAGGTR